MSQEQSLNCPGPNSLCKNEGSIFQAGVVIRSTVDECLAQCLPQSSFSKNVFSGITAGKIAVRHARDNEN